MIYIVILLLFGMKISSMSYSIDLVGRSMWVTHSVQDPIEIIDTFNILIILTILKVSFVAVH